MTQTAEIRAYLETGASLSQLEAAELFRCWRLAPRILELRAEGLDIETIIERRGKKRYARYKLRGPVQRMLFA